MRKEAAQPFQLVAHRVEFKQFLPQFQVHLYEGGDDVYDLAWFFQVERGRRDAFRHILHKRNQTLEVADHIALNRLGFIVLFLDIRLRGDMCDKVGFLLRKFADGYTFQALHDNLNGAIRHAYHTRDTRGGTNSEDVIWAGLLYISGLLGDQDDHAITLHDVIN